jgi:predicted nucleotidyltransferase
MLAFFIGEYMTSRLQKMQKRHQLQVPNGLSEATQYEVLTGSQAYGMKGASSDWDINGWYFPDKDIQFPHLAGHILGWDKTPELPKPWQKHHVQDPDRGIQYDFAMYDISTYFRLLADGNPNITDTLYTPQRCVLFCTSIGQMVRDRRKLFLSKQMYVKFRGYAMSQLSKIRDKRPSNDYRAELVEKCGYDSKYGSHVCRLMLEIEQILSEGDLDLERNSKFLIGIREGMLSLDELNKWFEEKNRSLETIFANSKLREAPDPAIKNLLLDCMEAWWGDLSLVVASEDKYVRMVQQIRKIVQ